MRNPIVGVVLLVAALGAAGAALADGRIALLIGNARYADPAFDLRNPAQDAAALAAALGPLGFETEVVTDAGRAAAEAALGDFAARAAGAEIALFFAGHGVQIAGDNRLLTAGLDELSREEIDRESLSLDEVRAALATAQPGLGIIVLDACRDNPLSERGIAGPGLARARGGAGLLIAYATDPGNVAYDGGIAANSVFTSALLENVATPGLEVRLMFGRVRQEVVMTSAGRQVPWVEEAVLGEYYLDPAPAAVAPDDAVAADVAAWQAATQAGDAAAYRLYLDRSPDGLFRSFADERIAALEVAPAADAPADTPMLLAAADPAIVGSALSTLGFLSDTRGGAPPRDLVPAFDAYARQMAGGSASVDGLYLDAAQQTVMLAAYTAQRIRYGLVALDTISAMLGWSMRDRAELARSAEGSAAGPELLAKADADIAAIAAARDQTLARLDEIRTFYGELVERASQDFRPYLSRSLAGLPDRPRGLPDPKGRVVEDAALFVQHATADGVARAEGSMAWLADFLPQR